LSGSEQGYGLRATGHGLPATPQRTTRVDAATLVDGRDAAGSGDVNHPTIVGAELPCACRPVQRHTSDGESRERGPRAPVRSGVEIRIELDAIAIMLSRDCQVRRQVWCGGSVRRTACRVIRAVLRTRRSACARTRASANPYGAPENRLDPRPSAPPPAGAALPKHLPRFSSGHTDSHWRMARRHVRKRRPAMSADLRTSKPRASHPSHQPASSSHQRASSARTSKHRRCTNECRPRTRECASIIRPRVESQCVSAERRPDAPPNRTKHRSEP